MVRAQTLTQQNETLRQQLTEANRKIDEYQQLVLGIMRAISCLDAYKACVVIEGHLNALHRGQR